MDGSTKKYNPVLAARVPEEDYDIVIDVAYSRGDSISDTLRHIVHEYVERVVENRKQLMSKKSNL